MTKLKYNNFILYIALIYVLAYIIVTINVGAFTSDAILHQEITQAWKDGHNPLIEQEYMTANHFPYPPAFHFTLALVPLDVATTFGLLQVVLFPSLIILTYWFVNEFYGPKAGFVAVLLALSGFAFWDRPGQPIPNAVDMLLLPIVFYLYLRGKNITFVLISSYLIYTHLFYPLFSLGVLFVHAVFKKREMLKYFAGVGVLCMPLFFLYLGYIENILAFPETNEYLVPQYLRFVENPLWSICYLGYPLFLVSFFSIYYFTKKDKVESDWILILWALSFVPLLIKFPHRGLTYIAQPLAIMGGVYFTDKVKNKNLLDVLGAITVIYIVVQLSHLFAFLRFPVVRLLEWVLIGWA